MSAIIGNLHTYSGHPSTSWNVSSQEHANSSTTNQIYASIKQSASQDISETTCHTASESFDEDRSSDSEDTRSDADSFTSFSTNNDESTKPTIEDLLISRTALQKAKSIPPKSNSEIATRIIHILKSYSPAPRDDPSTGPMQRSIMENTVQTMVQQGRPLHFILPAFPLKSPNRLDKVLGPLPDMGEELALARLDGLCAQINEVYPGTTLSIISDGLVYNDLLGVSEEDVWNYGSELRRQAAEKTRHVSFARVSKLISDECPEPLTLEEYLAKASWYREELVKRNLPRDFDVNYELKNQINSLMTYRGYIKFLATDLKYEPSRQGLSKSKVKRMNEVVAKRMIERGSAFALAIQKAFPKSVRISIHESRSQYKLPISLFSFREAYTTPWHCACALELDGSWRHAHNEVFANDGDYELVYQNERPSYYHRKSELCSLARVMR